MPPILALGFTAILISWLFRKDMQLRRLSSAALWIPAIWLALVGSRPISLWLAAMGINVGAINNLEGSPLDMVVLLILMVSAVIVLVHRCFDWVAFLRNNKTLVLIYLYLALSSLWAEYGFVTFKRALKDFGHVLPALVLLTEIDPVNAIRIVFARVSYLLFPLSVVLIKYFPTVGRIPSRSHDALFSGVTMHKNTLGCMVFVFSLLLIVDLIELRRDGVQKREDIRIRYGMLAIGVWLLVTCNSVTSMICLLLACVLLWSMRRLLRMPDPRAMVVRFVSIITFLIVIEYTLDISGAIFKAMGRDTTLTGRTEIWQMVRQTHTDPLVGCGFYSFWSTEGGQEISEQFMGTLSTVHNGFLEMYLDCGVIGLVLLILLLCVWGRRSVREMLGGSILGSVILSLWLVALIRNFSETEYFRFGPLWFCLLLLMIEARSSYETHSVEECNAMAVEDDDIRVRASG